MNQLYILAQRSSFSFMAVPAATICLLFGLLGLAVSAALLPMYAPEDINWVLAHIE